MQQQARDGWIRRALTTALVSAASVAVVLAVVVPAQGTAQGTSQATIPARVKSLEGKVRTLERNLRTTTTNLRNVTGVIACISTSRPVPFAIYGNPQGGQGYEYRQPNGTVILTTAMDLAPQGQAPTFIVATINPQCIRSAAFKPAVRPDAMPR